MFICLLNVFFDEVYIKIFWLFLLGLLLTSCESSLYIWDNSPLADRYFADIFSQTCVFIFLMSFEKQKFSF